MTEFERGGRNNENHHRGEAFITKKRDSNNNDNDAAFLKSKRQRSMADRQEEEQHQPPQTRRMVTDGMGCVGLVERLAQSSHFLAVPSLKTTNLPNPTDEAVSESRLIQTSPPKLINREESSGTESSMSGSIANSSSVSSAMDDRESVFTPMTNTEGVAEIDSPAPLSSSFSQKKGDSVQPPADRSEQSSSSDEWVCRAFGKEVCENDISHRMWSLRRRGFDEYVMRIMDECVYESDDEDFMASPEGRRINLDAAVDEQQEEELVAQKYDGTHAHEPPLPEPIVVTPERLLL
ncbi:unnamed protein product [Ectocarpus sp. CCAP 1310/34]|nr:unnamed protein product [Ectocarpus sp. CCAP 1310/34]